MVGGGEDGVDGIPVQLACGRPSELTVIALDAPGFGASDDPRRRGRPLTTASTSATPSTPSA